MKVGDADAATRMIDEFLWSLRAAGFTIGTSQAIHAMRAASIVGLADRSRVQLALRALVVQRRRDLERFDTLFARYFGATARRTTLYERLVQRGFSEEHVAAVSALLDDVAKRDNAVQSVRPLFERGCALQQLLCLASNRRVMELAGNHLAHGFVAHRVLEQMGAVRARDELALMRTALRDAFGDDVSDAIALALRDELDAAAGDVRAGVSEMFALEHREVPDDEKSTETTEFAALTDAELDEARRAVREFARTLKGGARAREKRVRRGRIDPHKTLKRALMTGGVPFERISRARKRSKPALVLLCDVSDSVRAAARFMLEFVYAAQELFSRTRSFVFVSELAETTELFDTEPVSVALGRAYSGELIAVNSNSNYGRVFRDFEQRFAADLTRDMTVVVLGDGRTNYQAAGAELLGRIGQKVRSVIWLCPERPDRWGVGDSAMFEYARYCSQVLSVATVSELEVAARALVRR